MRARISLATKGHTSRRCYHSLRTWSPRERWGQLRMVTANTRKRIFVSAVIGAISISGVAIFLLFGYTPVTTGYVENDTVHAVTLDNCSDASVTVLPGSRQEVAPFLDARVGCTVFIGASDLGAPVGCLYMPSSRGRVISGSVALVSAVRRTPGHGCP